MAPRQWLITLLAASAGCSTVVPPRRDPAREAEQREHVSCPLEKAPDYPAELFDARSVVSVKPIYLMVRAARTGPEYRLCGAAIQLRPIPALSSDRVESVLICHNARSELARPGEPVVPNDPYWIAGQPVDVSVKSEGGGLLAEVRATDFDTAKEILRRANDFAAGQ